MARLTAEEVAAIRALKRVAKKWPKSLWLYSASGNLNVMRAGPDGERVHRGDGIDQTFVVDVIHGISNDGGDW